MSELSRTEQIGYIVRLAHLSVHYMAHKCKRNFEAYVYRQQLMSTESIFIQIFVVCSERRVYLVTEVVDFGDNRKRN